MRIRRALISDQREITELWKNCFGDSDAYVEMYIENKFDPTFCVVMEHEQKLIGMIHLIPCRIFPQQKALYWYAAGVHSDWRNQGLFRKMAKFVKEQANEFGYQNVCVPAPGLEGFYQSIGFSNKFMSTDKFFYKDQTNENKTEELIKIEAAEAEDFIKISRKKGDVVWQVSDVEYAMKENSFCRGKAIRIKIHDNQYVCFAIEKDDGFLIDYHNLSEEVFEFVKKDLFDHLDCEFLIFRNKGNEQIVGLSDSDLIGFESKITMTLA